MDVGAGDGLTGAAKPACAYEQGAQPASVPVAKLPFTTGWKLTSFFAVTAEPPLPLSGVTVDVNATVLLSEGVLAAVRVKVLGEAADGVATAITAVLLEVSDGVGAPVPMM